MENRPKKLLDRVCEAIQRNPYLFTTMTPQRCPTIKSRHTPPALITIL
jgi:hypothetical protein